MASTSLIFILWNASSTQAMMIIAMVTMPVTVVTAPLDSVVARFAMVARRPDGRCPGPTVGCLLPSNVGTRPSRSL